MNSTYQDNYDRLTSAFSKLTLINKRLTEGYEITGVHTYTDIQGSPLYWRIRLKREGEKIIYPIHKNDQDIYIVKEPDFPNKLKPIYCLHELHSNSLDPVYITEGEACVDTLKELGLLATTSGSSTSASQGDWSILAGRSIVIWPDADKAGINYAKEVTALLQDLNCKVQWIDTAILNLPEGGDVIDWLDGYPRATKALITSLTSHEPPPLSVTKTPTSELINYPRFELNEEGLHYYKDATASSWICSWLVIKALSRDHDGDNWGRVLEFKDADNNTRSWTMPMEMLGGNGDDLAKGLLRLGLRLAPGIAIRKLLIEYITNSETDARVRCVLRTGWHGDHFVLPEIVYGKCDEHIVLQSSSPIQANYQISGGISEWQHNVAMKCKGNSRLIFALSVAFAGPLLNLFNAESGGFHIRGESSTGKTTTLKVAASVWGNKDYIQMWRATDNGLEALAAEHNDTLLILDELSQLDPKYAGEVAYMLANGQGKARAVRGGSGRLRAKWRLLFLSSGEISLASHMLEAGKRAKAGQEVRMIDIPADAGKGLGIFEELHSVDNPATFADSLKGSCEKYYGVAGDAFLKNLITYDKPQLLKQLETYLTSLMSDLPAAVHGQVKRVARRFAMIALGGELAGIFGITGWQQNNAFKAVQVCFKAWLESKDGGTRAYEDEFIEEVRHFFQENRHRFDTSDNPEAYAKLLRTYKCAGFRNTAGDFLVFPETFKKEICARLGSPKDIAKKLIAMGLIKPDPKTKAPYTTQWIPTVNQSVKVYHFTSSVIGSNEEGIS